MNAKEINYQKIIILKEEKSLYQKESILIQKILIFKQ